MVIVSLTGGLGNQMFQYAAARGLALRRNVELKLDCTMFSSGADQRPAGLEAFRRTLGLQKLAIVAPEATTAEIAQLRDPYSRKTTIGRIVRRIRRFKPGLLWPPSHFREKTARFDPHVLDLPGDTYLEGYWQSEKYFLDCAAQIRAEFSPRDPAIAQYARQYVANLRSTAGGPIVSLHIRRGDIAHAIETVKRTDTPKPAHLVEYVAYWGDLVSHEFISAAAARFGPECRFLIFSDTAKDIQWCRENIRVDAAGPDRRFFSDGHSDIQDMAIMAACDHHIIAKSTFSWWAAWLDNRPGRRVITPRGWAPPSGKLDWSDEDLLPADWERIGPPR